MNPTGIEDHLKLVLLAWMIIIAVAFVFGRLGRRVGQPLAVGEIFAGILLGPSILGALWPEGMAMIFPPASQQSLQLLAKLGIILLMFQVGMEFDYGHLATRSKSVVAISLMGILAPCALGLAIGPWLYKTFPASSAVSFIGFQLFICIALSISALPIMGRILLEMNLERTSLGAVAISAAAIDDVIGWIFLAVATALVTTGFAWWKLGAQLAGLLALVALLYWGVEPWLGRFWRSCRARPGAADLPAQFLAVVLITLFACCYATNRLGIFSIFGAFLLGVALHREREFVAAWRNKYSSLVLVAFVPIFFTNTGLNTKVTALNDSTAWLGCAIVLAAAVAGKLGGCWLGARFTGMEPREALSAGALMNTRALMGLVAINIGRELGLLSDQLFTMFVLMALLTTVMCGPLLRWWLPPELKARVNSADARQD